MVCNQDRTPGKALCPSCGKFIGNSSKLALIHDFPALSLVREMISFD